MWKPEHRRAACRRGLRYPSDVTDVEWALVEPLIPPAKRGGRRRTIDVREVLNAIFYVLSTGCQWDALPSDLPPKSTVYDYLDLGIGTARWSAFTTRSMSSLASRPAGKPARVLPSSTRPDLR
jgi:transposase